MKGLPSGLACRTVGFVDEYCEAYRHLFEDVRSYECFNYLHVGLMSELKRRSLPAIARFGCCLSWHVHAHNQDAGRPEVLRAAGENFCRFFDRLDTTVRRLCYSLISPVETVGICFEENLRSTDFLANTLHLFDNRSQLTHLDRFGNTSF